MGFDQSDNLEPAILLPDARLLRLRVPAALVTGRIHPDAIRTEWWTELSELALQHGLGPLLLRQVQRAGRGDALGAALATLREARARETVQTMLVLRTQAKLQETLSQAGIPCLWLKGVALAQTVYPAPDLRPMLDVDLLVPYAQRSAALHVLEAIGYRLLPQLFDGTEALKHHYALQGPEGGKILVELHFRLLGAADRLLPPAGLEWFWQQTMKVESVRVESVEAGRGGWSTLRPEAHLLYLAAHALLQHGEADLRLLRFFDLHQIIATTPDFDWGFLVAAAASLGWTYSTARGLQWAHYLFATPLPETVLEQLAARRPEHDTIVHAQRRGQARTLSEAVLHDLATMGWGDRLRTAQRIILPPPAYMKWRYQLAASWQLPAAYWARWRHMGSDAWRTLQRRAVRHG